MNKRLSLKQILASFSDTCFCARHFGNQKTQVPNTEVNNGSVCPENDLVSEEKAITESRRIKVVITRKQLDRLLAKQVSLEQLVFANQRTNLSKFDESKWIPRLESIHESPELFLCNQSSPSKSPPQEEDDDVFDQRPKTVEKSWSSQTYKLYICYFLPKAVPPLANKVKSRKLPNHSEASDDERNSEGAFCKGCSGCYSCKVCGCTGCVGCREGYKNCKCCDGRNYKNN